MPGFFVERLRILQPALVEFNFRQPVRISERGGRYFLYQVAVVRPECQATGAITIATHVPVCETWPWAHPNQAARRLVNPKS